ncbi:MAG: deoxyribose-phosphate aldolase [Alkaliphilus sp.]|nr:deoxyribose-phosphate aldolase [Alkaliphilus sp.]
MDISKYIDHTILKADASKSDIVRVCNEAIENLFYSVCVNSWYIPLVKKLLEGSEVKITSVVGFPLGAMDSTAKAYEAKVAVENGADEIDMVINISAIKDGNYEFVLKDIKQVVDAIGGMALLKVIIETALLSEEEKSMACKLSMEAGADFVKTSTGFSTAGATVEDIKLMRSIVGDKLGVKASGGIRTREIAIQMIEAGANRLGVSASVSIVKGMNSKSDGY